jgi:hypothetical protein
VLLHEWEKSLRRMDLNSVMFMQISLLRVIDL